MRVLHVITSLLTGGAEKLMVDLLPRLRDKGDEVRLVVFNGTRTPFYEELEASDIEVIPLRMGGSVYDPRNIWALSPYLKWADIVHTHNTAPQLFVTVATKMLRSMHRPILVTTEHNTSNRRREIPLLKPLDLWMYHQYEKIICISNQAEQNLKQYLGCEDSKIVTVFNGINLERFMPPSPDKRKLNEKKAIVTMVAAFRAQKDQKTLIQAISLLPDSFILQLVGTGDPTLIEQCRKYSQELKIEDRVCFLGNRTDIPQVLHGSDIIVLSSHYEGLSLSSLEAMASGRPFVASDVEGLSEIVNGYGMLFPHEDANALASILLRLSQDDTLWRQTTAKCQERAKQFDITTLAGKYQNIYDSFLTLK